MAAADVNILQGDTLQMTTQRSDAIAWKQRVQEVLRAKSGFLGTAQLVESEMQATGLVFRSHNNLYMMMITLFLSSPQLLAVLTHT